ncbi:MAG: amidohydrolase family protein [Deltaproteobacteria bacterium]|nr:amidohydrolase family protein [Deltaproteobacteria bacterium]
MTQYDLVINNGKVVDPLSKTEKVMNLGIVDDQITTITLNTIKGKNEIDATGCVVAPGFIDIHTHVDGYIPGGNELLKMGVTSAIGGNCGMYYFDKDFGTIFEDNECNDEPLDFNQIEKDWGECLNTFDEQGFPVNIGMFVGGTALRSMTGLSLEQRDVPANAEQIQKMVEIATKAMNDGAFGVSFGLAYSPGTTKEELVGLFQIAANFNGLASIHPRNFGAGVGGLMRDAIHGQAELIEAAKATGAKLQIGHISHQLALKGIPYNSVVTRGLKQIEDAQGEGVDVMADCLASACAGTGVSTGIADVFFYHTTAIEKSIGVKLEQMWKVASGPYEGQGLTRELFEQLRKEAPRTGIVSNVMREDLMLACLIPPYVMVSSDVGPNPVPSQTKVLGQYVRENPIFSLSEALYKLSTLPAMRLGLESKGKIGVGCDADLTIFNPETVDGVIDNDHEKNKATGVEYVVVNGKIALEKGEVVSSTAGKSMRHKPW